MTPTGWIVAAAAFAVAAVVFFLLGIRHRKNVAEKEISSAEDEAKRIINEAIKSAEGKKREALLEAKDGGGLKSGAKLMDVLRREGISYTELMRVSGLPEISEEAREQVEISAHYEGYIDKQKKQVERLQQQEGMLIPDGVDFANMEGLRLEARQKLSAIRPKNIGQPSRISGVSPADIGVLLIQLKLLEEK